MKEITLESRYGNLNPVTFLADENGEISYRQAVRAAANCAGNYFPGLEIDRANKRAFVRNEE